MRTEDIKALRATLFGWLAPNGELIACPLHRHLEALAGQPGLEADYAAYRETLDANAQMMAEELSSLGEDDAPMMHRFDGQDDDAKAKMTLAAYQKGWIRLGIHKERFQPPAGVMREKAMKAWREDPTNFKLEAEGLEEAIDAKRRDLRDLAAILDVKLSLREMAWVTKDAYGRHKPPQDGLLAKEVRKALQGG